MSKQATAAVFAAGETPQLWVDGQKNVLAVVPGTPAGALNITDVLELGRGGRPTNPPIGYFKGRCSFFGLCDRRLPDEVLATITRAFADPPQVYGHGTANRRGDAVSSPVALLVWTASTPGTAVSVDVGAASYDPGGLALTCTEATILTGNGNVTRSGDTVTITPASNTVAGDLVAIDYTIRNSSLKTSSSRVYLIVGGTPPPAAVVATDDPFTATVGVTASYGPLSNDTGGGGPLTISSIGTPSAGGQAQVVTPGRTQVSYTPRNTPGTETLDYVVSDGVTSDTGRMTFTVSAGAQPVKANPDSYTATAGAAQTYTPLENDDGTGLTITGLGALTGGSTATVITPARTDVRYTPRASTTNYTEGLTYTISDGTTSANGVMTFTVAGVSAPTGLPKKQPTVAVNRWHCVGFTQSGSKANYVAGRTGFAAAVAAANLVAGDVIVLADGTYSGAKITTSKNGTKAADGSGHIMVRSRTHGRAIIDLQLETRGAYWWFEGIKFTFYDSSGSTHNYQQFKSSILAYAHGLWVTNCKATAASFMKIWHTAEGTTSTPIDYLRICYNDLLCVCPAAYTDMGVIMMDALPDTRRAPTDTDIAWNRMTYTPQTTTTGASRNFLIIHPSKCPDIAASRDFRWHHNHMRGNVSEMIYSKRNIAIEYNYMEWLASLGSNDITIRQGMIPASPAYNTGGKVVGNRLVGSSISIETNGAGITINGNVLTGGAGDIQLFAGSQNDTGGVLHDATDFAQVVDNPGFSIVVGYTPAANTKLDSRGGWPNNVRIYKGDRGWNPAVSFDSDKAGAQCPSSAVVLNTAGYGTGDAVKVTTIAEADLATAGCDVMP